jgi:hypothetical protein
MVLLAVSPLILLAPTLLQLLEREQGHGCLPAAVHRQITSTQTVARHTMMVRSPSLCIHNVHNVRTHPFLRRSPPICCAAPFRAPSGHAPMPSSTAPFFLCCSPNLWSDGSHGKRLCPRKLGHASAQRNDVG